MGFKNMFRPVVALDPGFYDSKSTTSDEHPLKLPLTKPAMQSKEPTFGTNPIIKTFYAGKRSANVIDWVETPPKQLKQKVSRAYDRVAIKIYKLEDREQPTIAGRTPLKIQRIEVQSPVLVTSLKDIVEHEGIFLEAHETATFTCPFKPLFFSYDKIFAAYNEASAGSILKEHLHLLTQLLTELFGNMMTQLRNLKDSKLISYKLAWAYFPRDSIIYCGDEDCERLYRVNDTEYQECPPALIVSCRHIVFTGATFEWMVTNLEIPHFKGNLPISGLPNYPLLFHANPSLLKSKLIARGKKVLDYQGLNYCEYAGTGNLVREETERHNVSGRILVDFYGYAKHHKGLERIKKSTPNSNPYKPEGNTPSEDSMYLRPLSSKEQQTNKTAMLAINRDLVFVSPMVCGFALREKLWLEFYIDDVKPVVWNDEAYAHLVYPEEHKDLVLTFVENHKRMKAGLDDVIIGKGQGLISLLSGPPGTGKTLLAEAVADKTRRPLYYLQAEELGTDATKLGEKVKKVFEMATEWNAVILLDEADVFMAKRSPEDVVRNELVSIFLRELEYFQGIIFLTTNLYSTIDPAFRSRVTIHLLFSPLALPARLQLWQKFLSRLPSPSQPTTSTFAHHLSDADLHQLARWELNGREIKNAIKTVRTWCLCKGYKLGLEKLESGIRVTAPQARKLEDGGE